MDKIITKGEGVPDFILLETISEDAVVDNLRTRYGKNLIYVRFRCTRAVRSLSLLAVHARSLRLPHPHLHDGSLTRSLDLYRQCDCGDEPLR